MTSLPRFSVENPILVNLAMMAMLIGGAFSGSTLVREMFPESRPNRVLVTTQYPGATPTETEKGITLKIEEKIKDVEGVRTLYSTINEGVSTIVAELESGFDEVDQVVTDIKSAIDNIPTDDFPAEALQTQVAKFDPKWPVLSVALYGDLGDRKLKNLGDRLKREILELPGVTDVRLNGTRKDEISIELSPGKLAEYNLSFLDVAQAVRESNLDLPGGQLRTEGANVAVRTLGETDISEELADIVIFSDASGRMVRIKDVAIITDGFEDVDILGLYDGHASVDVVVYKTEAQDAIEIASMVRAMVAGKTGEPLTKSLVQQFTSMLSGRDDLTTAYELGKGQPYPPEVNVAIHNDLSVFIEGRLELLSRNGFWGLVLVTLCLLLFLHWRVAIWVMMGLVLAVAGSLVFMHLLGQTLNLITMLGLIIVLGLLVDDAIIVAEHVYSKIEKGMEPKLAAISASEEVSWPVSCTVLTTIVTFIPLMYMEGQIGDWIGVLPVVVSIALAVSLFESLAILPSHLAHGVHIPRTANRHKRDTTHDNGLTIGWRSLTRRLRLVQKRYFQQKLVAFYEKFLRLATSYRYVTIATLAAMLIITVGLVASGRVPYVLIQKMDSETVVAHLDMRVGTPIDQTREAAAVIERAALEFPELKNMYTLVGMRVSDDLMLSAPQSHLSQVFIELVPSENRDRTSEDIVNMLRENTSQIAGMDKLKFSSIQGGPGGAPFHLEISGDHLEDLSAVADEIKKQLVSYDGVSDIVDDFDAGRREVQVELFDSARALGLTTESLATQVRAAFYGYEANKVQRGSEDVKIMVRYLPAYRRHIYDIETMRIKTPSGALVPFTEVARLTEGTGFASIRRKDQRRTVTVTADVNSDITPPDNIIAAISQTLPDLSERYPDVRFEFGGQKLETQRTFSSLKKDFLIASLMIYIILAGLFKSYVQPLIVMSVIPFGAIGAVIGHLLMGFPFTMLSAIGLVALTGIVVNDSLVLVVFVNRRLAEGIPIEKAVIESGKSRLRPILLTSMTTVFGVAPLLMERSFQAKFLIPMALSIAAGLAFATVLTLIAVPSLYLIIEDMKRCTRSAWSWLSGSNNPTPAATA